MGGNIGNKYLAKLGNVWTKLYWRFLIPTQIIQTSDSSVLFSASSPSPIHFNIAFRILIKSAFASLAQLVKVSSHLFHVTLRCKPCLIGSGIFFFTLTCHKFISLLNVFPTATRSSSDKIPFSFSIVSVISSSTLPATHVSRNAGTLSLRWESFESNCWAFWSCFDIFPFCGCVDFLIAVNNERYPWKL